MTPDRPRNETRWFESPLERDRYIEGQLSVTEGEARDADVARDPRLQRRIENRRRFLERLAAAGEAYRTEVTAAAPAEIEERLRGVLADAARVAARRTVWSRRFAGLAAAAVIVMGVGLALFTGGDEAAAIPPPVLAARELALEDLDPSAPETCIEAGETSPYAFPLVKNGELRVRTCGPGADGQGTRGQLTRLEDLPSIGYVAVPDEGTTRGARIGRTDLGDVVVYDVLYGRTRYYLGVKRSFVAQRGDCAACHGSSREGQANPHTIELRSWR